MARLHPRRGTRLGQALADAATLGILHQRAVHHAEAVRGQLQGALDDRVVVEQAEGVLAAQSGLSPADAFTAQRHHAGTAGLELNDLCRGVVAGTVDLVGIVRPAL